MINNKLNEIKLELYDKNKKKLLENKIELKSKAFMGEFYKGGIWQKEFANSTLSEDFKVPEGTEHKLSVYSAYNITKDPRQRRVSVKLPPEIKGLKDET